MNSLSRLLLLFFPIAGCCIREGGVVKEEDDLLSFFCDAGEVPPIGIGVGFNNGVIISIVDPVPMDSGLSFFIFDPGGERD